MVKDFEISVPPRKDHDCSRTTASPSSGKRALLDLFKEMRFVSMLISFLPLLTFSRMMVIHGQCRLSLIMNSEDDID